MTPPIITYVETAATGHCPAWVRAVAEAFVKLRPRQRLHVWLPAEFRKLHQGWAEPYFVFSGGLDAPVRFACYDSLFESSTKFRRRSVCEIILRCVATDRSQVCFIANHVDRELKNIALGRFNSMEAKLVGIMDFPILHYGKLSIPQNAAWLPRTRWLKRYALNLMAARRRVAGRFLMMDPLAPESYRRMIRSEKYRFLPESYSTVKPSPSPRAVLNLPEARTLLLFIGGAEKRKGICELLRAIDAILREQPELCGQIAFALAGRIIMETRETVLELLARLRSDFPGVPFIVQDGLLSDQEFVDYMAAADIVCIPYVNFVGTSGLLVHAAHAGRPVLSTDFGIVGELVRRYDLGIACDTSKENSLQKGLTRAVEMARDRRLAQPSRMADFIRECAVPAAEFGETLVRHLIEVDDTIAAAVLTDNAGSGKRRPA
jgi:glycosyltransferase involved in cell wall biosynthesis